MSYFFREFFTIWNPQVDRAPLMLFKSLDSISYRALSLLRQVSLKELKDAAGAIGEAIDTEKELYVETELENYIENLAREGGGELRQYFSDPEEITRSSLRRVLADYPEAAEEIGAPREDDLEDLNAIRDALDYDRFQSQFVDVFSGDQNTHQVYAVLCLMKIEECLSFLKWKKSASPLTVLSTNVLEIGFAADIVIESVEALGAAEMELALAKQRKIAKQDLARVSLEKLQEAERRERHARAQETRRQARLDGTAARTRQFAEMAAFARESWNERKADYTLGGGRYDRERFARELIPAIGERFRRKSTSKLGKKGDPLTPKVAAVLGWLPTE
jgi:hypothetical protein